MKKTIAAVAAVAVAWTAWPYWSAYSLANSIIEGDAIAIRQGIEWDTLRAGVRDDIRGAMAAEMAEKVTDADGGLGAGFAALIGPAIVDRMVDSLVTPEGLTRLMTKAASKRQESGDSAPEINFDAIDYAFFTGPTTFRVDVVAKDDQIVTALFGFDGSWRLQRLVLPTQSMFGGK